MQHADNPQAEETRPPNGQTPKSAEETEREQQKQKEEEFLLIVLCLAVASC